MHTAAVAGRGIRSAARRGPASRSGRPSPAGGRTRKAGCCGADRQARRAGRSRPGDSAKRRRIGIALRLAGVIGGDVGDHRFIERLGESVISVGGCRCGSRAVACRSRRPIARPDAEIPATSETPVSPWQATQTSCTLARPRSRHRRAQNLQDVGRPDHLRDRRRRRAVDGLRLRRRPGRMPSARQIAV